MCVLCVCCVCACTCVCVYVCVCIHVCVCITCTYTSHMSLSVFSVTYVCTVRISVRAWALLVVTSGVHFQ